MVKRNAAGPVRPRHGADPNLDATQWDLGGPRGRALTGAEVRAPPRTFNMFCACERWETSALPTAYVEEGRPGGVLRERARLMTFLFAWLGAREEDVCGSMDRRAHCRVYPGKRGGPQRCVCVWSERRTEFCQGATTSSVVVRYDIRAQDISVAVGAGTLTSQGAHRGLSARTLLSLWKRSPIRFLVVFFAIGQGGREGGAGHT